MTTDALTELCEALGWSRQKRDVLDWPSIEAACGFSPPLDYRSCVEVLPPGQFQGFLKVLHPAAMESAEQFREALTNAASRLREGHATVYPDRGGLIPWAVIGFDWTICWSASAGSPDQWTVAVCDPETDESYPYHGSATEFLRDFVHGRSGIDELSYITEDGQPPRFVERKAPVPSGLVLKAPDRDYWLTDAGEIGDLRPPIDAVSALREAAGASARQATSRPDWVTLQAQRQIVLPDDYVRLVNELPDRIGPYRIASPLADGQNNLFQLFDSVHGRAVAGRRPDRPNGPFYPEPGGLIPWAVNDDGGILAWVPTSPDPNEWPVAALDATFRTVGMYPHSASGLLLRLLTAPDTIYLA